MLSNILFVFLKRKTIHNCKLKSSEKIMILLYFVITINSKVLLCGDIIKLIKTNYSFDK